MFTATGDDNLARLVSESVLALELVRNRLPQFGNASARRIFRESFRQRLGRSILDVLGRIKIRLAGAEADYILAFGLHLLGLGINGQRQRWRERRCPSRYAILDHKARREYERRR